MTKSWLEREVANGMQRLIVLRLQDSPAQDVIKGTLQVWLDALRPRAATWTPERDAVRIRQAFQTLIQTCERWPVPRDLLNALPLPAPQPALPQPAMTPEERQRNKQRFIQMMQQLNDKMRR